MASDVDLFLNLKGPAPGENALNPALINSPAEYIKSLANELGASRQTEINTMLTDKSHPLAPLIVSKDPEARAVEAEQLYDAPTEYGGMASIKSIHSKYGVDLSPFKVGSAKEAQFLTDIGEPLMINKEDHFEAINNALGGKLNRKTYLKDTELTRVIPDKIQPVYETYTPVPDAVKREMSKSLDEVIDNPLGSLYVDVNTDAGKSIGRVIQNKMDISKLVQDAEKLSAKKKLGGQ
jgi:hypothetical protein